MSTDLDQRWQQQRPELWLHAEEVSPMAGMGGGPTQGVRVSDAAGRCLGPKGVVELIQEVKH